MLAATVVINEIHYDPPDRDVPLTDDDPAGNGTSFIHIDAAALAPVIPEPSSIVLALRFGSAGTFDGETIAASVHYTNNPNPRVSSCDSSRRVRKKAGSPRGNRP